ncbi:MAG: hypothetical protein ACOCZR_00790 [Halanaerobiales bacterium]
MTEYNDLHDLQEDKLATQYGEAMYRKGFIDALKAFAWWKNGEQYVGTGTTLKEAIKNMEDNYAYDPQLPEPDHELNDDFEVPF